MTQRVYRVKTITKIQFLCQIDKMQIYNYINKIFKLCNFRSRRVDKLKQNFRYQEMISINEFKKITNIF